MKLKSFNRHLSTIGIAIFVILYIISTRYYPGGSVNYPQAPGFSWANNYWCDLMDTIAINGMENPASPIAISGMIVLCISMGLFFYHFPDRLKMSRTWLLIIKISGLLAVISAALIFTRLHNLVTTMGSIFGFFAILGVLVGLVKKRMGIFLWTAILIVLLLGVNNYVYYTGHSIHLLPILQKITFVIVLIWMAGINTRLAKANQ